MIINIKHKGLRKFAETGNNAGIPQQFTQRLKLILTALRKLRLSGPQLPI